MNIEEYDPAVPLIHELLTEKRLAGFKGRGYFALRILTLPSLNNDANRQDMRVNLGELLQQYNSSGQSIEQGDFHIVSASSRKVIPLYLNVKLIAENELAALGSWTEYAQVIINNELYKPAKQPAKIGG